MAAKSERLDKFMQQTAPARVSGLTVIAKRGAGPSRGATEKYHYDTVCATMWIRLINVCPILALIAAVVCLPAAQSVAQEFSLNDADADNLTTGQFVWRPELAPSGPMRMVINLREQRAFVYRDDILIGISTISSGKRGYETPIGTFTVLEKRKFHRSNEYDDAPMPYMQRLTWKGLAMHGGHVANHPDSHGCVRLPPRFAQALFKDTTLGMPVTITDQEPGDEETSSAS